MDTRFDIVIAGAGMIGLAGKLFDDFVIRRTENVIHVLNTPSPAATGSLAVSRHIAGMAARMLSL
jgi:L-2-hydroxyglutarate oxidase LhgO